MKKDSLKHISTYQRHRRDDAYEEEEFHVECLLRSSLEGDGVVIAVKASVIHGTVSGVQEGDKRDGYKSGVAPKEVEHCVRCILIGNYLSRPSPRTTKSYFIA